VDFRFADFEIDLAQRELRRAGATVHLEPQVFDLLVHLVQNRDRIVSKDELIDTIWGGRIISEAALSSRINAVRRALGDTGTQQAFVKTLHKRGFRFVGEMEESSGSSFLLEVPAGDTDLAPDGEEPRVSLKPVTTLGPSIAVLPFQNLSADPDNEYFSYGMTEDIIRLLVRNRWLTVISRHTTITFKDSALEPRQIAEALDVRYVVTGSVRRSEDRIRINVELIRAADGSQLWSELYDLRIEDIFGVQEEMARQIAATVEPELSTIEQQLASRKSPENLDAWDCYQRGLWHFWSFTPAGFDLSETYFQRAVEYDPNFARAYGGLSYVNVQRALYDTPDLRPARLETALRFGRTAVGLDERDCFCHCTLGRALCLSKDNVAAQAELEQAINLNPSFAQAFFAQGFNVLWAGRPDEAEALLDRATMLSPRDNHLWSFHHVRAWAHFALQEYQLAAEFARRAIRQPNVTYRAYATLVASLGQLADPEAEASAMQLIQKQSDYTGEKARSELFFCNDTDFVDRFVKGLTIAGVPVGSTR
jgi:TolB-like protein/DNA-binding winged helix-turn-helix (wHTH) protein/Tfp pilus assembly protein PilF